MNTITEAEVFALLEQFPINEVRPISRLSDMETIGFVVTPHQPSSHPTEHVPAIGQILSVAPLVEEITYGGLVSQLKNGTIFALECSAYSKLDRIFRRDDRCSEYVLKVIGEDSTSVSIKLGRKGDTP